MIIREADKKRFMNHVRKTETCWIYEGGQFWTGYGAFHYNGNNRYAHRISYLFFVDEIPQGMCVCHTCDNRMCVNPHHLFLGTIRENNMDMKNKGRQSGPYGEKNANSKLTLEKVNEIRSLHETGEITMRQLSFMYNITESTISHLLTGRSWRRSYWLGE